MTKNEELTNTIATLIMANKVFDPDNLSPMDIASIVEDSEEIMKLLIEEQNKFFRQLCMANAGLSDLPEDHKENVLLAERAMNIVNELRTKACTVYQNVN